MRKPSFSSNSLKDSLNRFLKRKRKTGESGNVHRLPESEKEAFAEFYLYLQDRRRLFRTNFLAGMMRGMGFAVGFSILGAVIVVVVQRLALDHLPVIGEFFAEVVRYVQQRLY